MSFTLPDDDFEIEELLNEWENDGVTWATGCSGAYLNPGKRRKLTTKKFKPDDMFPHRCPDCGQAAYIGANKIECSNPSCRHAV